MIAANTSMLRSKDPVQAAIGYADLGWHILPVYAIVAGVCGCYEPTCTSPGKHPMTVDGLTSATTDRVELAEWFDHHPNSNIGVRTGTISGFIAIDIDIKHGGNESLAELIAEHGPLPETVQARTGSGGSHYLFACPRFAVKNRTNLLRGVDVRGDGGYIVVAPSCHISGGSYEWIDGHAPDEIEIATLPHWLAQMLRPDQREAHRQTSPQADVSQGEALVAAARRYLNKIDGACEGARQPRRSVLRDMSQPSVFATPMPD